MNYRKKSPVVKAVQYTDEASAMRIMEMIGSMGLLNTEDGLQIATVGRAKKTSWVINHGDGDVTVCPDAQFKQYYEKVEG